MFLNKKKPFVSFMFTFCRRQRKDLKVKCHLDVKIRTYQIVCRKFATLFSCIYQQNNQHNFIHKLFLECIKWKIKYFFRNIKFLTPLSTHPVNIISISIQHSNGWQLRLYSQQKYRKLYWIAKDLMTRVTS